MRTPTPDRPLTGVPGDQDTEVAALVASLTLDQKLHQLSGDLPRSLRGLRRLISYNSDSFSSGEDRAYGIPPFRFADGPRGLVLGASTCFPVSMARGATWDPGLEERIGDAIGVELRSHGANLFGGVCINLLRHPGWGRAQETYGEDPFHVGEMGAALVRGVQRHAMACVKHYACNSIENSRFKVSVEIEERTLRETYLPHFRRCIEEGAAVVMTAYNRVNGTYAGHHAHLNRDILKGDWGFTGFTISDWFFGVRDGVAGLAGGLDVEMPMQRRYGRPLRRAVLRGEIHESLVDEAVQRVVRTKLAWRDVGEPDRYGKDAIASHEHVALAREAATRAMVLLENREVDGAPVLPLDPAGTVAVIGELADREVTGDKGSSAVSPPYVVTPLAGLRTAVGGAGGRLIASPSGDLGKAVEAARQADVAVVVVGYTHRDEGEYVFAWGGDRSSLRLREEDEGLVRAVAAANPRTVAVLVCGSAVVTERFRHDVGALVVGWYAGMEGGHALADLLSGARDFTGRLPCSFPVDGDDLPEFDPRAKRVTYGPLHGYRWHEARDVAPAYPFGFGRSYAPLEVGRPRADRGRVGPQGQVTVTVPVGNLGERSGREVVQVYASAPHSAIQRVPRWLVGFAVVEVVPGERQEAQVVVPVSRLAHYDVEAGSWVVEPTCYVLGVGTDASPSSQQRIELHVEDRAS